MGRPGWQAQVEQGLCDGADGLAQGGVVEAAPGVAVGCALGQGGGLRGVACPALQPFADAAGVGLQGDRRTQGERAVVEVDAQGRGRGDLGRVVQEVDGVHGQSSVRLCALAAIRSISN